MDRAMGRMTPPERAALKGITLASTCPTATVHKRPRLAEGTHEQQRDAARQARVQERAEMKNATMTARRNRRANENFRAVICEQRRERDGKQNQGATGQGLMMRPATVAAKRPVRPTRGSDAFRSGEDKVTRGRSPPGQRV